MKYVLPIEFKEVFDSFWQEQMYKEQLAQSSDPYERVHSKRILESLDHVAASATETIELSRDQAYMVRDKLFCAINNDDDLSNRAKLQELLDDIVRYLVNR